MRRLLTVVLPYGTAHDIELDAPEPTRMSELADRFAQEWGLSLPPGAEGTPAAPLYAGGTALPGDMTLADSPLRDGVRVGLGRALPGPAADGPPAATGTGPAPGSLELRIVAGDGAGTAEVHRIAAPLVVVPLLPGRPQTRGLKVRVWQPPGSAERNVDIKAEDLGDEGRGYALLNGHGIGYVHGWAEGELLVAGDSCLTYRWLPGSEHETGPETAAAAAPGSGPVPAPPAEGRGGRLLITRPPRAALPALPGPPAEVPLPPARKWQTRGGRQREIDDHRAALRRAERRVRVAVAARSRHQAPDPAEVLSIVTGRTPRLWERRPGDPDFLSLRCGLDVTARPFWHQDAVAEALTDGAPVPAAVDDTTGAATVSLQAAGVLGVAGPGAMPRRAAAWFAAQIVALHAPQDVTIRVLAHPEHVPDWRWLEWLPRSRACLDDKGLPWAVADPEVQAGLVRALLTRLDGRRSAEEAGRGRNEAVVLIMDGAVPHSLPGAARLLEEGPAAGIHPICLDVDARHLPAACATTISLTDTGPSRLTTGDHHVSVLPDLVPAEVCDRIGRALAPLRDAAAERREEAMRPARLPELLGLEPPAPERITALWRAAGRTTRVPVGLCEDGPFTLDLVQDGPHALVAGATGAGQSELLRTWVASLAAANPPDELAFVLIDYLGGSSWRVLAELPHVTGVLTELDRHAAARLLTRLGATMRGRERRLAENGLRDIADYAALRARQPELPPLPRLVFVIDEFPSLEREFPELAAAMADIARAGRAMGVHFVLGVGGPDRVLMRDLLARTNLRIALRTRTEADSVEAVRAPDAARIPASAPGRAHVRAGRGPLVEMQTARTDLGPPAPAAGPPHIGIREYDVRGRLAPAPRPADPDTEPGRTDLDLLVTAIRKAAEAMGVTAPPGPLPPPLAEAVTLSELAEPEESGRDLAPVAYGLQDIPDELALRPAVFDLLHTGSLSVTGARGSGRSQFLRTLAAALARRHSSADVHLFGIDCDAGALYALSGLPHCGAVVAWSRPDRIARLLGRLIAAVYSRKELLATGGFEDIVAQRRAVPSAQRMPYLVVLLDGWESFAALDEGASFTAQLQALIRDGHQIGLRIVLTGERALLERPLASLVERRLVLGLDDPADYRAAGLDPRMMPLRRVPGRAFFADSGVEVQVALVDGPPHSNGQTEALDALGARLRTRDAAVPAARRPFRIEDIPRFSDQFHVGPGRGRPVGREDVIAWLRDRHATGACAALLGQRRAGKTWVLGELSRRLVADGFRSVHELVVPLLSSAVDSPDALAVLLDRSVRDAGNPAEALLDRAAAGSGQNRLMFLLDEVGRLSAYGPAAVSWLRDLGQAGAWIVYTGTEQDWRTVVRRALTLPGSSFGNDVNARTLGPLDRDAALDFLTGTAANLGVNLGRSTTAARIVAAVGTWPFYLQVVGDAVVRAERGGDLGPLNRPEALRALIEQRLLDEWDHHFQSRWDEIGPAGRAGLLAVPGELPRDAARAQRQDLRDVGLLGPGDRWLDDPPFLAWIARHENSLRDGEPPP